MENIIKHEFHDQGVAVQCIRILPDQIAVQIEVNHSDGVGYLTESDLLVMLGMIKSKEKG